MNAYRVLQTATRALRRNVMRSILTTLGIIIGVAAVIAMMEIGNGSATAIAKTVASMGANNLMIFPGNTAAGGVSYGAGSSVTLTPEDTDAIARECTAIKAAAPVVRARVQIVYGGRNWVPNTVIGTTPDYLNVRDWTQMTAGDIFTDADVRNAAKVCVIGQTIATQLFPGQSPVGQELRVKNIPFKVLGVLSSKGANMMGQDQDDILLAPWSTIKFRVSGTSASTANQSAAGANSTINTLKNLYPTQTQGLYPEQDDLQQADTPVSVRFINVDQIVSAANSAAEIPTAITQMTQLLRERHRLREGSADDFTIRDLTEFTSALSSTTTMMTNLLLCVAAISLVVGGVGIMNIMLVSVTERTREIGLRMAVGARTTDILIQFMVEAILLCLAGGAMGILLGRGTSILVKQLLNWPTEISVAAIIAAVFVSATVGIVFGFYPAWKASKLDPIEALRYE
jgi:ABC-type antimicrobial peptide transport system permease subunit